MSTDASQVAVSEGGQATILDDSWAETFFANEVVYDNKPGAAQKQVVENTTTDDEPEPETSKARGDDGKFVAKGGDKAKAVETKTKEVEETNDDDSPIAGWDDSIVSDAKARGFSEEEIAGFGSEDALRRSMLILDKRDLERFRKGGEQVDDKSKVVAKTDTAADGDKKAQATETKTEQQQSTDALLQKLDIGLSDDFDEDVVSAFNKINDHYHGQVENLVKQNTALQQQVASLVQFANEYQNDRLNQFADRFFASVDEAYAEQLGKGTLAEVSPEAQKIRREIVTDALDLVRLAQDSGRGPKDLPEAMKQAMKLRFFDQHQQLARKEVAKKVEQRQSQSVARPTQRRKASGTPEQSAADFAERWYREHGIDDSMENELAVLGK